MRKDDERGVALLLALLILTLLVALVLEFDAEARREYREAAAFRDTFKANMLTRAAVQAARAVLQQDFLREKQTGETFDGLTDIWALPIRNYTIGDGLLNAQISDERGKFNLNDLAAPEMNCNKRPRSNGSNGCSSCCSLVPTWPTRSLIGWTKMTPPNRPEPKAYTTNRSHRPIAPPIVR